MCSPQMEIAQEEIFGPVAPIITATDEKEALELQMILNLALAQVSGLRI